MSTHTKGRKKFEGHQSTWPSPQDVLVSVNKNLVENKSPDSEDIMTQH